MRLLTGTHLLILGAASLDTKGRASQPIQTGTSTPGAIRISAGGVARNIAENLARLGEQVILLSAVGDDSSGRRILSQAAETGIDVSHVVVDARHRTAAYLAVLDETGNMATSIDDMAISQEVLTPQLLYRHRNLFRNARMIALDANLSPAALQHRLWPGSQVPGAGVRRSDHRHAGAAALPLPAGSVPDHPQRRRG